MITALRFSKEASGERQRKSSSAQVSQCLLHFLQTWPEISISHSTSIKSWDQSIHSLPCSHCQAKDSVCHSQCPLLSEDSDKYHLCHSISSAEPSTLFKGNLDLNTLRVGRKEEQKSEIAGPQGKLGSHEQSLLSALERGIFLTQTLFHVSENLNAKLLWTLGDSIGEPHWPLLCSCVVVGIYLQLCTTILASSACLHANSKLISHSACCNLYHKGAVEGWWNVSRTSFIGESKT